MGANFRELNSNFVKNSAQDFLEKDQIAKKKMFYCKQKLFHFLFLISDKTQS